MSQKIIFIDDVFFSEKLLKSNFKVERSNITQKNHIYQIFTFEHINKVLEINNSWKVGLSM